ncbi:hypothetical protein PQU92_12855 [Asticcacaulis sp. BYS171W]|uniref:Glycosyl hydrolase family 32 N-terminal domain-containing protein n=1 Tax=Asticcacaulis aquaticus TaxID=2984212 RepID=A0ABT5HW67_9CAUL|nr:hypothetical protein [Asticcacaulis aquaticus]MDC7684173.1 hypothetical protein [Asticcacaulis aquaticus]
MMNRRHLIAGVSACVLPGCATVSAPTDPVAPYRTPYKYGKLILGGTGRKGDFDEKAVDCPFVFSHEGRFYLTYVGFDGTGYQTGICVSYDLIHWERKGLILARDPADPVTRFNVASASILRENGLQTPGRLLKVNGEYVCAWHAYPSPGYEEGPAVIGLAFSKDLFSWRRDVPILTVEGAADWEKGGLYKPYLIKHGDTFILYYNAKTADKRWKEQTGFATSTDLKHWTRFEGNPILRNGPAGSPDARFASDPVVVQHRGQWGLFYFGLAQDGKARELLALGDTPTAFTKVPEVLIDVGAPGAVDDAYAHKPAVIYHKGDLYHFYCATGGKWPNDVRGISVARSRPW